MLHVDLQEIVKDAGLGHDVDGAGGQEVFALCIVSIRDARPK